MIAAFDGRGAPGGRRFYPYDFAPFNFIKFLLRAQSNLIHGGSFMLRYVLAAAAVSLISSAGSAQVVNGGFEAPVITDPCCNTAPPASNLPGWTVTPDVNVVNGTFMSTAPGGANLAFEGSQYLDLVGQSGRARFPKTS